MILVTGATGKIGSATVKQLIAEGKPVRALVRTPEKAAKVLPQGAQIMQGDLTDASAVDRAMAGVERVFMLTPVHPRLVDMEAGVMNAAKKAGVKQILKLSAIGANPEGPGMFSQWHGLSEQSLRSSGLPWTIIRPNFFMHNILGLAKSIKKQGVIYQPAAEATASFIDVSDIAASAAKILTSDGHQEKLYTLTGPEALNYHQVAKIIGSTIGRELRYVNVAPTLAKQAMMMNGMPEWLANAINQLFDAMRNGVMAPVTEAVPSITGREGKKLEQFVQENKAVFA